MFKVNQKVWCAIYGAGVVKRIRQEAEVDYPVVVVFNRNDDDESVITYTAEGKYHEAGNVTLFTYPIEITKAVTKPSIEWSHVNAHFKYLAMDADGKCYLYTDKPLQGERQWVSSLWLAPANHFASLVPGTCDWRDALVKRPN